MATASVSRAKTSQSRELEAEFKKRVSGEVRFDPYSRMLYSTDASIYQMDPVGVVIPRTSDDVLAVMDVAARNGVPVMPRCGGTSLAGQAVNHAIVMDFSKYLDRVIEVNRDEHWARVEPGIVLDHLNRHLAPLALQYAPDPTTSNRACVGGGVGNNTCGSHSVIYGKTVDHVLELKTVLSDGSQAHFGPLSRPELEAKLAGTGLESQIYREVRRIGHENRDEVLARYPKIMRRVSGYNLDDFINSEGGDEGLSSGASGGPFNLSKMVVGSEGTMCVVTEAKVNLVPVPPKKGLAVLSLRRHSPGLRGHLGDPRPRARGSGAYRAHDPGPVPRVPGLRQAHELRRGGARRHPGGGVQRRVRGGGGRQAGPPETGHGPQGHGLRLR